MKLSRSLWNSQRKSIHILHISGFWKENYLHSKECIHQLLVKQHLSIHFFLSQWSSKNCHKSAMRTTKSSFISIDPLCWETETVKLLHLFIYFANKLRDYINSFPAPDLQIICETIKKTVTTYLTSGTSTDLFQSLKHLQHLCFEYMIYGLFGVGLVTREILEDKHWINPEVILIARRTIPQPSL